MAYVNGREVPVLISDEKEALLAAKAAGRAIVGLWRPGQDMDKTSAAKYVVEHLEDVTDEYLERVVRRHLGLPWRICETERLVIRELFADDFDEIWDHEIGNESGSVEELESVIKQQYAFHEFGLWGVFEKTDGELVGVAGLNLPKFPENGAASELQYYWLKTEQDTTENEEVLELGYHIFSQYRRRGYAMEACRRILEYGEEEFGVTKYIVRIAENNERSKKMAGKLGFRAGDF